MEIRTATSPHDLQALAHVVERVADLRIGVDELYAALLARPEAKLSMRAVNARLGYEPQPPVVLVIGPLGPHGGVGSRPMHLRPPSIDRGITSFIWAFVIGLMLWLFMLGIGISKATSFIIAALVACGIFLYVRLYGEDEPRRRSSR